MHQHLQATGSHISLIAHITQREFAQNLHRTEAQNGFANRCLWAWVQRSDCLPEGGSLSGGDLSPVAHELRRALDWAAATPEILIRRDAAARDLWADRYPALSQLRLISPCNPTRAPCSHYPSAALRKRSEVNYLVPRENAIITSDQSTSGTATSPTYR